MGGLPHRIYVSYELEIFDELKRGGGGDGGSPPTEGQYILSYNTYSQIEN